MPHPHPSHEIDVWSVEGRFQHLIYSPRGAIEGVLIDSDGIPTQFVTDPEDLAATALLLPLKAGQLLVVEGTESGPSPKGGATHTVYDFERLASVDGQAPRPPQQDAQVRGVVVRFNYARHGAANGVVLDSGDFVHTRPDGLAALGLKVGDTVSAEGAAQALVTGLGRVIEARRVNGQPVHGRH